jgi:hypothetical protein
MRGIAENFVMALRRAAHGGLLRAAWFALTALIIVWPLFSSAGELNEFRDSQILFHYEDVAARTVREFGQWPLWDPYYCGGLYLLGTPQSRFAAPPFILSVLFGALRAAPLIAFAMSMLGMEGFFRFARMRSASALGPALIAPLFAGNGFIPFSYFHGWLNFYGFLLLPWVLYGADATLRGLRRGPLVIAASFAFIVGFGGTYAGPLAALLMLAHLVRALLERPRLARRPLPLLGRLALAAVLALALSSYRLWPVIESMVAAPRFMAGAPAELYQLFRERLFELSAPRSGNYGREGQQFVGSFLVPLCLLGALRLRALPAIALGLLCAWVATGYAYPHSLFATLRSLPVLELLRYPERFLFLACIFAYEVAALGVDKWVVRTRRAPVAGGAMVLVSACLMLLSLQQVASNAHASARGMWTGSAPVELARPFKQTRGNRWLAQYYAPISRGSISCWEAYPVPMSPALRGDLAQEEYLLDASAGSVERKAWSPNRIELAVELKRATRLLINQNYHVGWHANLAPTRSHEGLLALDLPAGKHELKLRFRPRSALFGALVSVAAAALALGFLLGRRRLFWGGGFAIPLLLLSSLLYDEPFVSSPPPQNADGTPLLAAQLPKEAKPLSVSFEPPVRLEGVVATGRADDLGIARFELDWRVLGELPRSVGVSVHFESTKGRFITSDHHVIGASTFFDKAPRDVLLRDAFSVVLGNDPEEHWKVFVCLWNIVGDGARLRIKDGGGALVDRDRVLVAEF